jgi:UTP:GlnB (protein PII) uridylyltransferase
MYSMLYIETADRPGLLLEIIKIIADTNIDVESAEIDTEVWYFPSSSSCIC